MQVLTLVSTTTHTACLQENHLTSLKHFFLYLKCVSSKSVENTKRGNRSTSSLKITKGYAYLGKDFYHVIRKRGLSSGILTPFLC